MAGVERGEAQAKPHTPAYAALRSKALASPAPVAAKPPTPVSPNVSALTPKAFRDPIATLPVKNPKPLGPAPKPTQPFKTMYSGFPKPVQHLADLRASQYRGESVAPEELKNAMLKAAKTFRYADDNILARFVSQGTTALMGMPQFIYTAGKAGAQDYMDVNQGKVPTHLYHQVAVPVVKSMAHDVGYFGSPLVHGNFGEFAHRVNERPFAFTSDVLAVVSAGAGVAGRAAAASTAVNEALNAARVATVDTVAGGVTRVGGRFYVEPQADGSWAIKNGPNPGDHVLQSGLPSREAAVKDSVAMGMPLHYRIKAQSAAEGGRLYQVAHPLAGRAPSPVRAAIGGFAKPGAYNKPGFNLLDTYDALRGKTHGVEHQAMIDTAAELAAQATGTAIPSVRQATIDALKGSAQGVVNDWRASKEARGSGGTLGDKAKRQAAAAYDDLMTGMRLGTIYAHPAYIANNWVGNGLMSLIDAGPLAPVELAKSVVMFKHIAPRDLQVLRSYTGANAAQAIEGTARGRLGSLSHPVVNAMGKVADQPFRDAAMLHALRRAGYNSLADVNNLLKTAREGGPDAASASQVLAKAGRKAQEAQVKFANLGRGQAAFAKNLLFVWSWARGSARYTARFPLEHPFATDVTAHAGPIGAQQQLDANGGVPLPWYLKGAVVTGHNADGSPRIANPGNASTLTSGVQLGQEIVGGAEGAAPGLFKNAQFNGQTTPTPLDSLNPGVNYAVKSWTSYGGGDPEKGLFGTMSPVALYNGLTNPGQGKLFPGTPGEAFNSWMYGNAVTAKTGDPTAMDDSVVKGASRDKAQQFDLMKRVFEKRFGGPPPWDPSDPAHFTEQKVNDSIKSMKMWGDFKKEYFKKTLKTPKTEGQAALDFIQKNGLQIVVNNQVYTPEQYQAFFKLPKVSQTDYKTVRAQLNHVVNLNTEYWWRKFNDYYTQAMGTRVEKR